MYRFGLIHPDERNYAPPEQIDAWLDDPSSMPNNPAFDQAQEVRAQELHEKVYPLLRPRPRRHQFDDFYGFLIDEADQLEDVYDAGDDLALWDALAIVRDIGAKCAWADAELDRRIDEMRRTSDVKAFIGKGVGRASPKRVRKDRVWKAYVHVAYAVARHAGYIKKASALEVAARILEKVDTDQHGYDVGSVEYHLETPRMSVLRLLTIEHASELTNCCCAWLAYIEHNEPLPLRETS